MSESDSDHADAPGKKPSAMDLAERLEECFKDVNWSELRKTSGKLIKLSEPGSGRGYEKEACPFTYIACKHTSSRRLKPCASPEIVCNVKVLLYMLNLSVNLAPWPVFKAWLHNLANGLWCQLPLRSTSTGSLQKAGGEPRPLRYSPGCRELGGL